MQFGLRRMQKIIQLVVGGQRGTSKNKHRQWKLLRSINVQREGFRSDESKAVVLNGGIPEVFFIPPLLAVQYKVTRIPVTVIPVASLAEKEVQRGDPSGQHHGFLVFHVCPVPCNYHPNVCLLQPLGNHTSLQLRYVESKKYNKQVNMTKKRLRKWKKDWKI